MSADSDRLGNLTYEKITKRKKQQDRMYKTDFLIFLMNFNDFLYKLKSICRTADWVLTYPQKIHSKAH